MGCHVENIVISSFYNLLLVIYVLQYVEISIKLTLEEVRTDENKT